MVSMTAGVAGRMLLTIGWIRDENPSRVFSKPVNLSFFIFCFCVFGLFLFFLGYKIY